jgi:acyl carrier protein
MQERKTLEKLKKIFNEVFDNEEIIISEETSAQQIDEWDSLSNIRLFVTIEKEFGIKFSAHEIAELKNVGEMEKLINIKIRK